MTGRRSEGLLGARTKRARTLAGVQAAGDPGKDRGSPKISRVKGKEIKTSRAPGAAHVITTLRLYAREPGARGGGGAEYAAGRLPAPPPGCSPLVN